MKRPGNETDEEVVENAIKTIETVPEEFLKYDVYAVFSILTSEKLSDTLVKKYVYGRARCYDLIGGNPIWVRLKLSHPVASHGWGGVIHHIKC